MKNICWGTAIALATVGCSNPLTPTPIDAAAKWALDHINEVCIASDHDSKLIPVTQHTIPIGYRVVPISYCNPAE